MKHLGIWWLVLCLIEPVPAGAKDLVLILDEPAQRDLIAVLDAARKQVQSLDIVEPVARTWQRLKAAPEITAHTEDKSKEPELLPPVNPEDFE